MRQQVAGTSIAGGWRGMLVGTKADGKMRVQMHNLDRYYRCKHICEGCAATNPSKKAVRELSYGNLLKSAPWRLTLFKHAVYLQSPSLSPWLQVTGFHLMMIWRDLMHGLYQGVGQDLGATLIVDLFLTGDLASTDDSTKAFKLLFLQLREWCVRHRISPPVKLLTPAALNLGKALSFPLLSSEYKAVHVKVSCFLCQHLGASRKYPPFPPRPRRTPPDFWCKLMHRAGPGSGVDFGRPDPPKKNFDGLRPAGVPRGFGAEPYDTPQIPEPCGSQVTRVSIKATSQFHGCLRKEAAIGNARLPCRSL